MESKVWLVFEEDDPACGEGHFKGAYTSKEKVKEALKKHYCPNNNSSDLYKIVENKKGQIEVVRKEHMSLGNYIIKEHPIDIYVYCEDLDTDIIDYRE